jgi:peptidoglycan/xylan/chitin deacetylase (PgdA/CDA1 family)
VSAESYSQNGLREIVAAGLYHSGALRLLRRLSRDYEVRTAPRQRFPHLGRVSGAKFVILCYHRVGFGGFPFISSVTPQAFEAQMRFLREHYRILSLEELCYELESPTSSGQALAVTFDDGYRDLYTNARAILKKYEVPATVFLTVKSIETGQVAWYDKIFLATHVFPGNVLELDLDVRRRFDLSSPAARLRAAIEIVTCLRRLPDDRRRECCNALEMQVTLPAEELAEHMLTWEQIGEMQQDGIAFGSHTVTHPVVSRLPAAIAEEELSESKRILEDRLGRPVKDFAYPFGQPADCGLAAETILRRCGYRSAATTSWGVNAPGGNLYQLRRVQIGEDRSLAMFAFQLNRIFLQMQANGAETNRVGSSVESPALSDAGRIDSEA